MTNLNIPEEIDFKVQGDRIMFALDELTTGCMPLDDGFIKRIDVSNINPAFVRRHIACEIKMKNLLDEARRLLENGEYAKAIRCLDEVLAYDDEYGEALLLKSKVLCGQKHFVKSLRHYRRAVKADDSLKSVEYQKSLMGKANDEREHFPKIKLNIYAGDEHFSMREFDKAVESYNRALVNPSKFKEKILFKLLNKKATSLLKLEKYNESIECFEESIRVSQNDYAYFGKGLCEYNLGLNPRDSLEKAVSITKRQMLEKALIYNDLGFFEEALTCFDKILECHFRVDELYLKALNGKMYALRALGRDLAEIEEIFEKIN